MTKAVVLLSGGLDSATTAAIALAEGYEVYALSVHYGQRHHSELAAAEALVKAMALKAHKVISVDLNHMGGSALTDERIAIPEAIEPGIPVTYVPARNTLMLSLALGWAEVIGARHIFCRCECRGLFWLSGLSARVYRGFPGAGEFSH